MSAATILLKEAKEIQSAFNKERYQHIWFNDNDTIVKSYPQNHVYVPTNTGKVFHDDDTFIKLVIGPYGSGKSTMCVHHMVRKTCQMPAWRNGRRRARWAIVRNTAGELQSTTLQTWLTWFGDLGDIQKRQKPLMTYEHHFNDGNGIVELELIFIALDREDDIRKIKSLEVTGVYINELSEVPENALSHFKGRLNGRYPSRAFCDVSYWSGIICDTNPPDIDHWIYRDFETKNLDSYRIFHQPPGLIKDKDDNWQHNYHCDNSERYAPKYDYYLKLAEGQTADFVKVYCLGEYGAVNAGKRVYPEYNDDVHAVEDIKAIQGDPIHLGWDFGLTPTCIVIQFTARGQLLVLKEYSAEDMGIKTFAENIIIPALERDFPYCKIGISRADPSGIKSDEIMEELSCIGTLNTLGITTHAARSNNVDPRIGAVKYFLNRMVDGKPGFVLSKRGCPVTRRGFIRDYCYKRLSISGEERYRDVPHKNASSHRHDALQYIAMEFAADSILDGKSPKEKVNMFNPVFRGI